MRPLFFVLFDQERFHTKTAPVRYVPVLFESYMNQYLSLRLGFHAGMYLEGNAHFTKGNISRSPVPDIPD